MLKYISTLVAAITPLMYFHGAIFHDSYLRALGAPPDLFRLPLEDVLVQGFTAYMLLSIPALLVFILYLLVALGAAYNLNEASKIKLIKRMATWVIQQVRSMNFVDKSRGHHLTEGTIKLISYSLVVVIALLIVLGATLGLAVQAEKLGKENANSNIKNPNKNFILQEIHFSNGSSIKGYSFECSSYGCVVYSGKKVQIVPLGKIESIDALISLAAK
jgi:hypothetical protein